MPIGLLGAGARAREATDWLAPDTVAFRAVHADYVGAGLLDISAADDAQRATPVVAAVGPPAVRRRLVEAWPGTDFATVVAASAVVSGTAVVGAGSVIGPTAVLGADVTLGRHVVVNPAATLAHDVSVGDYVTISAGARLGGCVNVAAGVWIGIGAIIADDVSLAEGVVVGAGAVVLRDVTAPNTVVAGVPARKTRVNDDWLAGVRRDGAAARYESYGDG